MWIYKYQEKFYFCRDLLKEKKIPKKIPPKQCTLDEDSPCARKMGCLPPTLGETRVWSCPFSGPGASWCLLGLVGSANTSQLCRAQSVHASVCTCVCVCVCMNQPFPRGKGPEVLAVSWMGWGWGSKPLSGVGGRVPSLVLLLADLRGNKKGSERLAGVCLCLPTPPPTLFTHVLLGIK